MSKSAICKALNLSYQFPSLTSNLPPVNPDILAFTRVELNKRRAEMAKQSVASAKQPPASAQSNNLDAPNNNNFMTNSDDASVESGDFEHYLPAQNDDDEPVNMANPTFVSSQPGGVSDLTDPEWIRNDWISYEKRAVDFPPFDKKFIDAINLLSVLRNGKASLGTYDSVMQWHFKANGDVHSHEKATSMHFLTRQAFFDFLKKRYNRDTGYGIVNEIVLPSRKTRVKMVTNDTGKVIQSMLTRPENKTEDYLVWDYDPFKRPPKDLDYIGDLNTGKCFSDTHDALINDPLTEVAFPMVAYFDGASIGHFSRAELLRFQIALGLFTREARRNDYNWGTLGWIPNIPKDKSQGRRAFVDSNHADSNRLHAQLMNDEGLIGVRGQIHPSQDLHAMISFVLKGLIQLQKTGFKWDLFYNGKLYKDITFKPFVAFMRVDTAEADLCCGKYSSRNRHVSQLCRECECPTTKADDHTANYRAKTQARIANLVLRKDEPALKRMSQQYILNAFHDVQFGLHNTMGIHGACPMEMLHAILLGVFKYARNIFFEQVGEKSQWAARIDALSMMYGELYGRQSDRSLPNTRFPSGIRAGKVNAKKYTGIILCLLTAISCKSGQKTLERRPKWREWGIIDDWIMLLETLLQWEAWLCSPKMMKSDVQKARTKHRYIMYLMRKVAARKKGMGLKLMKFHGILHMADAILNFGVPLEYDTGDNESHHISSKQAAQLTQKDLAKVEEQTAGRMMEMEVLKLAGLELAGTYLVDYRIGHQEAQHQAQLPHKTRTCLGGAVYLTRTDGQTGAHSFRVQRAAKGKSEYPMVEDDLVDFVGELQERVKQHIDEVLLYSCYTRNGVIFRGDLSYRGNVWRDWVIINWGRDGKLPNKIWGFVDLRELPDNLPRRSRIHYGANANVKPGIYAVVEATNEGCDGVEGSELFDVLTTEIGGMTNGSVSNAKFYLADVNAFEDTCTVVPNIGGPTNSYFWLEPRANWAKLFVDWLRAPHAWDETEDLTGLEELADSEESSEESDNNSESS